MPVSDGNRLEHMPRGSGGAGPDATETIRTLGPPVLRYLRAILRDEDDAHDAFSLWAESVWRGLPGFRGEAPLRIWAFQVAYRAAMRLTRGSSRRRNRRLATTEASRIAEVVRTTVGRREREREVLRELRRKLTIEEQTLIELRIDEGLSWGEIAEVLSRRGEASRAATIAKRFERVKSRLADLLRREGVAK